MSSTDSPSPALLAGGLCACGTLAAHGLLDLSPLIRPIGPGALIPAALVALIGGVAAGSLLGPRVEPPEQRGGGAVLLVALVILTALSFAHSVLPLPRSFWSAAAPALLRLAPWALVLALIPVIGILPDLTLGPRETSHDARLRRALAYWFTAWGAPAMAMGLLMLRGWAGLLFWTVALLLPLAPLLITFGVRLGEVDLLSRPTRARLAAVSWVATLPVLVAGLLREMTL